MNPIARAWQAINAWWLGDYIAGTGAPVPSWAWATSGAGVSIGEALSLPAVLRGISVYSDSVASLPRRVVRRVIGGGIELDETSDAARVLAGTSYYDLEGIAASSVSSGNGYALLSRNQRGGVESLAWIDSARVSVVLDERSRVFYKIGADASLQERERVVPASDVVHLKFRAAGSHSRYLGTSPLATCGASLQVAINARLFQAEVLRNVKTPAVTIKTPGRADDVTLARLRTDWDQNFGVGNRGRTAILDQGMTVETLDLSSAVDAELSKQFEFGVSEVARALGIPVSLLMQPGAVNYAQAVEETRAFAALSLQPFCVRFSDELGQKLLTPALRAAGYSVEFDLTRLLVSPGETAERMSRLVNGGVMTVNESRNELGLADVDGGDQLRVPVNVERMETWSTKPAAGAQPLSNESTPNDVGDGIENAASLLRVA